MPKVNGSYRPKIVKIALVAMVVAAAASSTAAGGSSPAPGQRLVDYVASHATVDERRILVGVSLEGGHVAVKDGVAHTTDVTAVVTTRLRLARAATLSAQRLCAIASVGVKRLRLRQVTAVEVRARTGDTEADSLVIGLPACHRWTVADGQTYP